jgi:predicted dehydrogenase
MWLAVFGHQWPGYNRFMNRRSAILTGAGALAQTLYSQDAPLRVVVAGLVHGHARGFFNRYLNRKDIKIVGIAEPDASVRKKYFDSLKLDPSLAFDSVETMIAKRKPEGVLCYTNTFDHLAVVKMCAAHKVPVMMEKPLAVSNEHAAAMAAEAKRSGIHVLVNYETTWYSSNRAAYEIARAGKIGGVRKFVIHDGHQGPKLINVPPEFFHWLTDPKLGGGGASFDFGCYGANLMTWFMDNQRPESVTAVTQRFQPEYYPRTDDEANIIVRYPKAVGIVQASWNWPFARKDMEVYGQTGYVQTVALDGLKVRLPGGKEEASKAAPIPSPEDDSLAYFSAVVRSKIKPAGLSSLENNLVVTQILCAARQSATSGKTISIS